MTNLDELECKVRKEGDEGGIVDVTERKQNSDATKQFISCCCR